MALRRRSRALRERGWGACRACLVNAEGFQSRDASSPLWEAWAWDDCWLPADVLMVRRGPVGAELEVGVVFLDAE